ncbi:MAG: prepilin-type N-terminal cleavage/methylation domain-containing protein [Planctomycetota bacterium]|nr:prepilin-type N-terminal cleavage/methylation domain-containing protein [Planctomycetota bacterium]
MSSRLSASYRPWLSGAGTQGLFRGLPSRWNTYTSPTRERGWQRRYPATRHGIRLVATPSAQPRSLASFEVAHSAVFVRQRRCVSQPRVAQLPWVRSPVFPPLPQRGYVTVGPPRDGTPLGYGWNALATASQGSRCAATLGYQTQPLRGTPSRSTPECAASRLASGASADQAFPESSAEPFGAGLRPRLFPQDCRRLRRGGFTLVEMLVAMTVTLILIFAISQTFAVIGARVAEGRATIEMAGSLRAVANRLQADLDSLTCPVRPWIDSASGLGYFEYLEGALNDTSAGAANTVLGDVDDMLMFTARSTDTPFVGRIEKSVLTGILTDKGKYEATTSTVAEIAWWMELNDQNNNGIWDNDEWFTLHRRVLLVLPNLTSNIQNYSSATSLQDFLNNNDISVHLDTPTNPNTLIANSLGHLTIRANRFAHEAVTQIPSTVRYGFPHLVSRSSFGANLKLLDPRYVQSSTTVGTDVILSQVLAFDVKAFDPTAELRTNSGEGVIPGDPGWLLGTSLNPKALGAFVDLNYWQSWTGTTSDSTFSGPPQVRSQLSQLTLKGIPDTFSAIVATYDTWAFDYERDGIDQDGYITTSDPLRDSSQDGYFDANNANLIDEGTDGLDNDGKNGVDDIGERETSPPYPFPLRGIQVKIRVYEPDTRQIRQMTVVADFTPE